MRELLLGAALIACSGCAVAATSLPPSLVSPEGSSALPPGAELPLPDQPLFAAPTTRDRIGRVIAPVTINGQGPYRFIVDTGATRAVLSRKLATALDLAKTGQAMTLQVAGVTGAMNVDAVAVERLQAGDLVLLDQRLPVINAVLAGADGILGAQGLEDKRLVVDFKHDRIFIQRSTHAAPSGFIVVPVKVEFDRLLVADAVIGRVHAKAIIDTGAERSLGNLPLRQALRIGTSKRRQPISTLVEGVTADLQPGDLFRTPSIMLGRATVNQISVTFGDLHVFEVWGYKDEPAILLGMDALGTLSTLVIDYKRKELQLLPYTVPFTVKYVNGRLPATSR